MIDGPIFTEFRDDCWPLCPQCGEDELYSLLHWDGTGERPAIQVFADAGMACYRCAWRYSPRRVPVILGNSDGAYTVTSHRGPTPEEIMELRKWKVSEKGFREFPSNG